MNSLITRPASGQFFTMPWLLLFAPALPIVVFFPLALIYLAPRFQTPEQIPYWTLLFGLPHIVSSFQTACDREYLSAYRVRALRVIGIALVPLAFYQLGASPKIMLTVNFVWTIYHVIAQQYGIAFGAARLQPSLLSLTCKWCTVTLGLLAYVQVSLYPDPNDGGLYQALSALNAIILPMLAIMTVAGAMLIWQARANLAGASLLALNILLFLLSLGLIFKTPYALVGLMTVRVLHDVTGFAAYIQHDTVRNRVERKNFLYRALPFLPIWFLNPVLAIIIAAALTRGADAMISIWWLMIGMNIAHYHMESFIWKKGTPHRQHLSMAT